MIDIEAQLQMTEHETRLLELAEARSEQKGKYLHAEPYLSLPHPSRLVLSQLGSPEASLLFLAEPQNQVRVKAWLREGMYSMSILDELTKLGDRRVEVFKAANLAGETNLGHRGSGTAGSAIHALRAHFAPCRHLTLHNHLVSVLHRDLEPLEADVNVLTSLGENVYLELGSHRDSMQAWLTDPETGYHPLEGAYLSKVKDSMGVMTAVEVTFTARPHDHLLNDVVRWVRIPLDRPQSVRSAVDFVYRCVNDGTVLPGEAPLPVAADPEILIAMSMVVQAIEIARQKEAEFTADPAATEAKKKVTAQQSSRLLFQSATRQAETQVDRTWITIPPLKPPCANVMSNAKRPKRKP
ncbi:MAG: hypothetical protein O9327_10500 [Polaromonas sp.]|nr:hypothetical protein [Polaromonas sp.]